MLPIAGPLPPRPADTLEQPTLEQVDLLQKASFRWRVDLIVSTKTLAEKAVGAYVERAATHAERWSDHAPVTAEFDFGDN
ncbi:hypothetical protein GCM10010505_04880 [Kitasatospora aburaviensis]